MLELRPSPAPSAEGSAAAGGARARTRLRLVPAGRLALPQGSDALLLVAVLALAVTLLALVPQAFNDDTWLALVAGRGIWSGGIPHHETLTAMSHGVRWVDEQWLSQLAMYLLYRAGGLGLLAVVNVALMSAAVGAAVAVARRRGARGWIVMVTLALCLMQIVPAREVRTQAFAMPLIVAVVALLGADGRRHTRRVYWCLPILILWANLHGTALLGAGAVSAYGLMRALGRLRHGRPHGLAGLAALTLGPPLCILATPYGLHMLAYYQSTMTNGAFKQLVTEWQPITSQMTIAAPFFLLAGLMVWSFGRGPQATSGWEKLVLVALAGGSILVIRNGLLFGLAALAIVPASLDASIPRRERGAAPLRRRLNRALCTTAIALAAAVAAITLLRPARTFAYHYQRPGLLAAVRAETAAHPSVRVFADVRYADWLAWEDPGLRGRIAYDASFELLSRAQLDGIVRVLSAIGPGWKAGARGYRLLVLDRAAAPDAVRGFLLEPGRRVLYDHGGQIVILRSARAAA